MPQAGAFLSHASRCPTGSVSHRQVRCITDESPRHDVAGWCVRPARVRVAVHITQAVSLGFAGWDMHTEMRAGFCGVGSAVPPALTVTTGREYYM